jgi:uncharacterized damage-inducible protein DinB
MLLDIKSNYRDNGAIGALLDEYEKALNELIDIIEHITEEELLEIVDKNTKDKDCRSIQAILNHVLRAGYNYAIEIRRHLGESYEFLVPELMTSTKAYKKALRGMFAFNEVLFSDHKNLELEEYSDHKKIKVRWGQSYDIEQLLEHAIVHILRHRRQIERFLLQMQIV